MADENPQGNLDDFDPYGGDPGDMRTGQERAADPDGREDLNRGKFGEPRREPERRVDPNPARVKPGTPATAGEPEIDSAGNVIDPNAPPDGGTPPAPVAPGSGTFDPTTFVKALKDAGVMGSPAAPAPAPQMSQEEFERKYNVFKPSAAQIDAIRAGGDEAIRALDDIAQGTALQSITMMQEYVNDKMAKMEERFAPLQEEQANRQEMELRAKFLDTYKDLQPYQPLLQMLVADAKNKQMRFKDQTELFNYFNSAARATLKAMGVTPAATPSGTNGRPNPSVRRMAPVITGGSPAGEPGGPRPSMGRGSKIAKQLWG